MASMSDSAGAGGGGRAVMELMVSQFLLKALRAILAVRSPRPDEPPPPAASAAFRRRDRWFHLPLHAPPPPPAAEHLPEPSPGEPLVVDVYLAPSGDGPEEVLERWTMACEPWPWPAVGEGLATNIAYKRCITLLRSLYAALRFLPAYRAFRTLCASAQVYNCDYEMGHRVGTFATPFSVAQEATMHTKRLAPVETQLGRLVVSVQYLPSLAAFTSLASNAIIMDYVVIPAAEADAEPIRFRGGSTSWSYRQRQEIGSDISSSSGTIASKLSSACESSGSRFSTFSMEAVAMHFDSLQETEEEEMGEEERVTSLIILVQEFFSIKHGDMSVVERWLQELGVGWLLNRDDGASAVEGELNRDARSWIRALGQITETFCLARPRFPDRDSTSLPSICQLKGEHVGECVADRYHLALFIQETMLKILSFVDVLVAWDLNTTREEFLSMDRDMPPVYSKLFNQLGVHDALSSAASCIFSTQLHWASKTQLDWTTIKNENEMVVLLSSYENKLGKAIRYTTEKIRKFLLEDDGDASSTSLTPQGSSDIHKVTKSVMKYISFLGANYKSVDVAISVKDVPHIENEPYLNTMIKEMVFDLQNKLAYISESFSNQALGFLFLLNNLYFIQESYLLVPLVDLNSQIKGHMDKYLAESWALLLSCLSYPTPLCLVKNYSPLSKFESEFLIIYTTQKQWKVPDPELRRRLRKVIIDKIIPGYAEYIEDNKVTNPKFSPQELKSMLQELFEG